MKIPKIDQPKPLITIDLTADAINKKNIFFYCPLCKKSKHSDKPLIHISISNGNINNRTEHYLGHCLDYKTSFNIHITDDTMRIAEI